MTVLSRTILVLLTMLALIAVTAPMGLPLAAQDTVRLIAEFDIRNSLNLKQPKVATFNDQVYVFGVAESSADTNGKARFWTKNEAALAFPAPFDIGTTSKFAKDTLYVNAGMTTTPAGDVITIWVDQAANIIYSRRRDPAGNWGPIVEVTRREIFAWEPALTVVTGGPQDGRIIAVWRDDEAANVDNNGIYYTFSDDKGASWAPVRRAFAMKVFRTSPVLASGPNGEVALTFIRDDPRPIHVMLAMWTGNGFSVPVDINAGDRESFTDSTVAIYNDRIYVGYRHVDRGIYYVEKALSDALNNQPWPRATLLNEHGDGRVMVVTDRLGNLHLTWIRRAVVQGPRNQNRIGYAVRLADGRFFGPIESTNNGSYFNPWAAASTGTGIYLHAVYDAFSGGNPIPRYALFQAPGAVFGSRPIIENDAAVVGGESRVSVNVTFPNLSASNLPDQVRWRWGAPPTDTENDSNGWQRFNPTGPTSVLEVPIPAALRTDAGCVERELFTQLRRSANNLIDQPRSDKVVIDAGVLGSAVVANPFSRFRTSPFTAVTLADLINEGGASDGHPDYTRVPAMFVEIRSLGDCSGLRNFALAPSAATLTSVSNLAISGNRFANVLPYPGTVNEGQMQVVLRIRDALGNPMMLERTFTYDVTSPTLHNGTLQMQAIDGGPSIVVTLQFTSLDVTDNLYPGRGFWGVWLANSRTPVANPATDPTLVWVPVEAPGDGNSFTIIWSLASGLPEAQLTEEGTYYVYARALDGAGNPSATALQATISIDQVTLPQVMLPMVLR